MGTEVQKKERARRPNGDFYSSDASERALQLKEDGKIGGQFGKLGGRPRKLAAEELAEKARERTDKFVEVLDDILDNSESEKNKLAVVSKWLEIEEQDRQRERQEQFDELSKADLVTRVYEMLQDPRVQRELDQGEVVDGTAEEL